MWRRSLAEADRRFRGAEAMTALMMETVYTSEP
jgi:hypothetical protein